MSRLDVYIDRDVFIDRMVLQRVSIDFAARQATGFTCVVFDTLLAALPHIGLPTRFVYADLGGGNLQNNNDIARNISPLFEPLLTSGGLMVSCGRMYFKNLVKFPTHKDLMPGRNFDYQAG